MSGRSEKLIVVCQNDYPIAIVETVDQADRIKAEKQNTEPGNGERAVYIHYHAFEVQRP